VAIMVWDEKYSVGIAKIDEQHKKLIGLVNKLYDAMREGKGKDILLSILEETLNYTNYHFSTEEEIFKKYNYSLKEPHMKEHKSMKEKVERLYNDVKAGNSNVTVEVFTFLKDWINNHILDIDMKYKNELADKF